MLRFIAPIIAICSLLFILGGRASAQSAPDHVKTAVSTGMLGTANTIIADAEGYFAAQNIEIEFVDLPSLRDAEALALLLTGEIDVAQPSLTPGLFNAMARDAQLKMVATASYHDPDICPYSGFVVTHENAQNFDAESLRGAHVAVPSGIAQYFFDRWLNTYGMSLSDITLEEIPIPARAEALVNGSVALAYLSEPNLTRVYEEFGIETIAGVAEAAPNSSVSALVFGPNMLNREDDLPVRYLTAFLEGSRQFNEGPTERNLEILGAGLEIEPEILSQICWIRFREDGRLNIDSITDFMNWNYEQGLLDETLDEEQFYDPGYVEQANQRLAAMTEAAATATAAE